MTASTLRATVAPPRTRDYRALMTATEGEPVLTAALDQMGAWLRGKKHWDIDLETAGLHAQEGRELLVLHHEVKHERSGFVRLTERPSSGSAWTTELITRDNDDGASWISLEVVSSEGRFVSVPRLATFLMEALQLGEGELRFAAKPQVFHANRLDELQDLLCDPARHGVVFVAGTDGNLDFDLYVHQVQRWTWEVAGLAQVVVLDPLATREFRAQFGATHDAPPWTIRTFMPEADPASAIDGRRHRILGSARLAAMANSQVRSLLGLIAREHTALRPLPVEVVRTKRTFERLENQSILGALQVAPVAPGSAPPAEAERVPGVGPVQRDVTPTRPPDADIASAASRYLAQLELAKRLLGVEALDEAELTAIAQRASREAIDPSAVARAAAQIDLLQDKIETLEDELRSARSDWDDAILEHAYTREDAEQLANENRYLRSRLRHDGDFDAAFGPVPEEWITKYPASYEELLNWMAGLAQRGIEFTGDAESTLHLASVDTMHFCLHTAWDAFLALADYVRARANGVCEKGVDHYLAHTPHGYRTVPPGKHGGETGETMRRYGDERVLPVPVVVDPSGEAVMKAHFKLGNIGKVSPRMYYLDGYGRSGRIYVGYIGPHLTNTQTKNL